MIVESWQIASHTSPYTLKDVIYIIYKIQPSFKRFLKFLKGGFFMNIQTNYKEVENTEKQGIELYFETIPTAEERNELKANGYKWNNAKKCWYIKKSKIVKPIELGTKEMSNSYSGYGWEGVNSKKGLSIVEIAKLIKKELKRLFPEAVFSVTTEGNAYYSGLNVYLMKSTKNPIEDYETILHSEGFKDHIQRQVYYHYGTTGEKAEYYEQQEKEFLKKRIENRYLQINQYYIEDDYYLTEYGKKILQYVKNLLDSFNYDDSDSMTDYFDCRFYEHISIGKWDKHFELIEE